MPDPELPPRPSPTPPTEGKPAAAGDMVLLVVPLRKFNLGQTVITANAAAALTPEDVSMALLRHSRCDWGDVCEEDKQFNERGVVNQGMILSAYPSAKGVTF